MNKILRSIAGLSTVILAPLAIAAPCNGGIKATSPTPRFSLNEQYVTDLRTNLTWLRCPVGYDFDANDTNEEPGDDVCNANGETLLNWADALAAAEAINASAGLGEPNDWRVPNIKELLSIVERQCVNPAINETMFPQPASTFVGLVWSATYSGDLVSGPRAYALDFSDGSPSLELRAADNPRAAVYLVR